MRSEVIGDFQEPYGAVFLALSAIEQSPHIFTVSQRAIGKRYGVGD
jgi:hypothetical protein